MSIFWSASILIFICGRVASEQINMSRIIIRTCFCSLCCITSGGKTPGQAGQPCVFPFTSHGKTYRTCTFDLSYVTKSKPWCSTQVDERGNHVNGKWGTCEEDNVGCPIPPRVCGVPVKGNNDLDRKTSAEILQVPWMVSLGSYDERETWRHLCGGSVVTNTFVLTAAHCLDKIPLPQFKMRLGNENLNASGQSSHDIIRNVIQILPHPLYRSGQAYFDVGLAKTDARIDFTDHVRPVCLPFRPVDDEDDLANVFVTLAGWGKDHENEENITNQLRVKNIRVNSKSYCESVFSEGNLVDKGLPPFKLRQEIPRGFQSDISCAGNEIVTSGACKGDSGSPLVRLISDTKRKQPYYEMAFVVSGGIRCLLEATLYGRVSDRRVLNWIQKETDTTPLLMVVGGYSGGVDNGLTSDVELISTTPGNLCSKRVRPLPGRYFDVETHIEKESSSLGMTGQVTKDVAVVCGGKNGDDNQRKCYVYDPTSNTWDIGPPMLDKRYNAASVIDGSGNMWVLGGADGSNSADSTEILDISKGRWTRGKPLPGELRDSGISSHCAVSINNTHVLIAGGFAGDYIFRAPNLPKSNQGKGVFVPGVALDKAWLFDGNYWREVSPMGSVRDRPACSKVQLPDGRVTVLVAGGCQDWCSKSPGVSSAEMFDPDSLTWTVVADLPKPLSSAKMEQLDGLATVVGGFDNERQNEELYQYHPDQNRWIAHPTARLRLSRSSAAVFQVPRSMFDDC